MHLNLGMIEHCLTIKPAHVCGNISHSLTLCDVRPWDTSVQQVCSDSLLYMTKWDYLAESTHPPAYLVCVGGGTAAVSYMDNNGVTGLVFDDSVNALQLFSIIQDTFRSYRDLFDELHTLLVTKSTSHRLINCCAKFFDNYTVLLDSEYNLLELSDIFEKSEEKALKKDTQTVAGSIADVIGNLKKHYTNVPPGVPTATRHINDSLGFECLQVCFYDANKCIAMLIVSSFKSPLYPHSLPLLQYIANQLQQCILGRYSNLVSVNSYIRAAIMSSIEDRDVDSSALKRNLTRIGWGMDDTYQLALIKTRPDSAEKAGNIAVYYTYENLFPDCIAAKNDSNVIIIIHNCSKELMNTALSDLAEKLVPMQMECGISLQFNDFLQIRTHFNQAEAALRLGQKTECIRHYKDVLPSHLVNTLLSGVAIKSLCHLSAIKIYEYDIKNGTELLLTLESYLLHNKSLQESASKLFIHRNTMTYRLNSIMKIADIALDDPAERLHILFSCIALRSMDNNGLQRRKL